MTRIRKILSETAHRPFELPDGTWRYYQEWNKALFLHWEVPFDILRNFVPKELQIDRFERRCYVSLVAFTMQNIRPKNLPAISIVSDFEEINLRTYIDNGGKKGVYFLSIEAEKAVSVFIARSLSGLPYEKANIKRTATTYTSVNPIKGFHMEADFEVKNEPVHKSALDKWLTERYCLYLEKDGSMYRYDIHHKEWPIKNLVFKKLSLSYRIGNIDLSEREPDLTHYSDGVSVIAWRRQLL